MTNRLSDERLEEIEKANQMRTQGMEAWQSSQHHFYEADDRCFNMTVGDLHCCQTDEHFIINSPQYVSELLIEVKRLRALIVSQENIECPACGYSLGIDVERCRICGCTHYNPCDGGCWWIEEDLCSSCEGKVGMYCTKSGNLVIAEAWPDDHLLIAVGTEEILWQALKKEAHKTEFGWIIPGSQSWGNKEKSLIHALISDFTYLIESHIEAVEMFW